MHLNVYGQNKNWKKRLNLQNILESINVKDFVFECHIIECEEIQLLIVETGPFWANF